MMSKTIANKCGCLVVIASVETICTPNCLTTKIYKFALNCSDALADENSKIKMK